MLQDSLHPVARFRKAWSSRILYYSLVCDLDDSCGHAKSSHEQESPCDTWAERYRANRGGTSREAGSESRTETERSERPSPAPYFYWGPEPSSWNGLLSKLCP